MPQNQENTFISIASGSLFSVYQYTTAVINAEISHVFMVGVVGGAGGVIGKYILQKTILFFKTNSK